MPRRFEAVPKPFVPFVSYGEEFVPATGFYRQGSRYTRGIGARWPVVAGHSAATLVVGAVLGIAGLYGAKKLVGKHYRR